MHGLALRVKSAAASAGEIAERRFVLGVWEVFATRVLTGPFWWAAACMCLGIARIARFSVGRGARSSA